MPAARQDIAAPRPRFVDRLRNAALKPEDPDTTSASRGAYELSGAELEIEEKRANDKERAIALVVGPVAALITFIVMHALVVNDPSTGKQHVSLSNYEHLFLVLIVLSFSIIALALWRKRLYIGVATSLFGLAILNLHYWGFGVPFIMVGAWYLVRAYRLQRNLKQSRATEQSVIGRPAPSKRYTPPSRAR
jgi:hypothetical protein